MKIHFKCEYCGKPSQDRPSHYKKKKRHFCSMACYANFRRYKLPKEEQHAYRGGGLPKEEKGKRVKARSDANHALLQGKLKRKNCEACGSRFAQMHHSDYSKPLKIKWLCRRCHWDEHRIIYENPELLK